jgi:hypothetical protein
MSNIELLEEEIVTVSDLHKLDSEDSAELDRDCTWTCAWTCGWTGVAE